MSTEITPADLRRVLSSLGVAYQDGRWCGHCPVCGDSDRSGDNLVVSAGSNRLVVCYCHCCCVKGDRDHNRDWWRRVLQLLQPDPLTTATVTAGESRRLWAAIGHSHSDELPPAAPAEVLDRVYGDLLHRLDLSDRHRQWLEKRGLDPNWAFAAGYRSSPDDSSDLAKQQWLEWGFQLAAVPGFANCFGDQTRLLLRRSAILIPSRNSRGQIQALKQRLLDGKRGRLRLLSSAPAGGPRAVNGPHVPYGVGCQRWPRLWLTEGERKADVVWTRLEQPVVATPGTGAWRSLLPLTRSLLEPGGEVVLAFDADDSGRQTTEAVAAALAADFAVSVADFGVGGGSAFKGIDDAAAAGGEIRTRKWEPKLQQTKAAQPPHKVSPDRRLRDSEILDWLRSKGPTLRSEIDCWQPSLSSLIRQGLVRILEYTPRGQLLAVVQND